ncbi:MAG TPA: hypothetical protein VJ741_03575 [Solirubrobacteraceae bacterium]|nr:hypothetical protein [Solirubrobacteraceae bacterium]
MTLRSLARRHPSAALVVSFLALFVSLGGAGWAALRIPPRSVGNAQLQNFSVGNAKLKPNSVGAAKIIAGAVGARQVNSSQVQLRVTGPCTAGAIQSIAESGNVTCTQVQSNEYGTSASPVPLGAGSTQVATESLPTGPPYLVLAYPHVVIGGTSGVTQRVEVDCTLSVPPGAGTSTATKSLAVELGSSGRSQAGTIPLVLPVASSTGAQTATVSCTDSATPSTPAPTVAVDATLNALQTASNN